MSLSNYLELELLDHVIGQGSRDYAQPTLYVALGTSVDDTGLTGEPSGNGYARKAHASWNAASSRSASNNGTITFAQASGSWGTMTDFAVFDALTGGNMLFHGSLAAGKSVVDGNTPSIASGEIVLTFNANGFSTYLANKLLDHVLGTASYTAPTIYLALCTAAPTDASTGSNITEPSGNNYSRKTAAESNWGTASAGAISNTSAIAFATPSGSWGLITHLAICDASTLGNMLFWSSATPNQTPDDGDTVQYPIGQLDITLD